MGYNEECFIIRIVVCMQLDWRSLQSCVPHIFKNVRRSKTFQKNTFEEKFRNLIINEIKET